MPIEMRWLYRAWYRWGDPPWVGGPRDELVRLVSDGTLGSGRALDLGCGTGANSVFLAQNGFDVLGIDYADSAIRRAREAAAAAGAEVEFMVGDVTDMVGVVGPFDVVVDYGTFDDLPYGDRPSYFSELLRVTAPGSRLLTWCFEHDPGRLGPVWSFVFGGHGAVRPGEIQATFGRHFLVEQIGSGETGMSLMSRWAAYLLERKPFEA